jgi:hypothetical protein
MPGLSAFRYLCQVASWYLILKSWGRNDMEGVADSCGAHKMKNAGGTPALPGVVATSYGVPR